MSKVKKLTVGRTGVVVHNLPEDYDHTPFVATHTIEWVENGLKKRMEIHDFPSNYGCKVEYTIWQQNRPGSGSYTRVGNAHKFDVTGYQKLPDSKVIIRITK